MGVQGARGSGVHGGAACTGVWGVRGCGVHGGVACTGVQGARGCGVHGGAGCSRGAASVGSERRAAYGPVRRKRLVRTVKAF